MRLLKIVLCTLVFSFFVPSAEHSMAADPIQDAAWRTKQFDAAEQAAQKGLPRTAIEHMDAILPSAIADEDHDDVILALGTRASLHGQLEGGGAEEGILRLQADLQTAPASTRPILKAILADWFYNYYQQNQWRFQNRTEIQADGENTTPIKSAEDLKTWSAQRIIGMAGKLFDDALENGTELRAMKLSQIERLLIAGEAPESYRPTVYDFVVNQAIDHFVDTQSLYSGPIERFELDAASPIFDSREKFLAWNIPEIDRESPLRRATELTQQWLRFRQANATERDALLDADWNRLLFGNNNAVGPSKDERFEQAAKHFLSTESDHPISTRASFQLAQDAMNRQELVLAHQIATAATEAHPNSFGANACQGLINQIEAPSIDVRTERIWHPKLIGELRPQIEIGFKNTNTVHLKLVRLNIEQMIAADDGNLSDVYALLQNFGNQPAVKQWSVELPETADFKLATQRIDAPEGLDLGGYLLIASSDAAFTRNKDFLACQEVWVSELALVTSGRWNSDSLEGYVVDGQTGQPVASATVAAWQWTNQSPIANQNPANTFRFRSLPSMTTDQNGRFELTQKDTRNVVLLARHNRDQIISSQMYSIGRGARNEAVSGQTFLFTDRSIYRPGQTLRFKAIATMYQQQLATYQTHNNQPLRVELIDPNGKTIATKDLTTNDRGSCHGSFDLPRTGLTGRMRLMVRGFARGNATIRVEEYKRPKFEVTIDAPTKPVRLDQPVTVSGQAKAYTGAPIDSASVRYTVVRQVQYPVWWGWRCWWMPVAPAAPQTITQGTTTTDETGRFDVTFDAVPDASVDRESEPTFRYVVTADVVDTTGETRSDTRTVSAGYTTLAASMRVADSDWLTTEEPIEINVNTTSLDGEGQPAKTKVEIWSLKSPEEVIHPEWTSSQRQSKPDEGLNESSRTNDPNTWPLGERIETQSIATDASGNGVMKVTLPRGHFRAVLSAVDSAGNDVSAYLPVRVIDPNADQLGLPVPSLLAMKKSSWLPGETFSAVWGTGYESAHALIEIEHRGKVLQRYWTSGVESQINITQAIDESMRGGFVLRVWMLHDNRFHSHQQVIDVPWTNKQWSITWDRFVSKLKPGGEETWSVKITPLEPTNKNIAESAAIEMVAALYDASLDAFAPHRFANGFNVFYRHNLGQLFDHDNQWRGLQTLHTFPYRRSSNGVLTHHRYVDALQAGIQVRYQPMMRGRGGMEGADLMMDSAPMAMSLDAPAPMAKSSRSDKIAGAELDGFGYVEEASGEPPSDQPKVDLSGVPPRKNLNETAFFFPELVADENGVVTMTFTMPEALTRWRLLGFAHDAKLASGTIEDTAVTSKDLMVQPNPPRTLREGDEIELTVKVSNQSAAAQTGVVALNLTSAASGDSVDAVLGNAQPQQSFAIPAGQSKTFSWRVSVPDGIGYLVYKAVGSTGRLSDGEEGFLPVLSRRILVHESISLPINGAEKKTFELPKLIEGKSDSLESESLTVQMTSNPAWYAVMALPYLMEYPHECSEQTFHRLYANLLARHIAKSDPRIERVFQQWKNQPVAAQRETLTSPLAQNEDLKSIALTETPWVLAAESETEARRNVGILFDTNRINDTTDRLTRRLMELQQPDGSFPWFAGGPSNDYITMLLVTGYGRLNHLGVEVDMQPAMKGLVHLDRYATKLHDRIKPDLRSQNHLSSTVAMLLYGRSFYLDQPVAAQDDVAVQYWLDQAAKHWLSLPSRMSQAHVAMALHRFGRLNEARGIVASLIERAVVDDQGMHWNDAANGWWWYQAPIETQAMMIEVLDEVASDSKRVDLCQAWLLRQKETQSWETTKSTADAIYSLLLRGTDKLASDELVDVSVGEQAVPKADVEAGTGFYQHRFSADEITPAMGSITVTKTTPGIAWGGVHWQYFENIEDITPHDGTPLQIEKQLFVVRNTDTGPVLRPVGDQPGDEPVRVGDELVSRLIVRSDRDMEFLHLRDHRGSGTEPVNVLSGYRRQDALGYYQSTRDAAEHFFIGYLTKGTYVLESRCRVQLRGKYQTGMASIESMYAPQYNSHSESHSLQVE